MRNPWLCICIVANLGLVGLVSTGGIIYLSALGKEPSGALVALASGAIGALSSFLVSPPRGSFGGGGNTPPPGEKVT